LAFIIRQPDVPITIDLNMMGVLNQTVTPGLDELSVSFKYHDRVCPPVEKVNSILRIDGHAGDSSKAVARRDFGPIGNGLIFGLPIGSKIERKSESQRKKDAETNFQAHGKYLRST
jgi:hypothetical protein